jgi:hypothetical protein
MARGSADRRPQRLRSHLDERPKGADVGGLMLVITVGLVAAIILLVLWSARLRRRGSPAQGRVVIAGTREEQNLVAACFGDLEVAQRLIQYELDRRPSLSRRATAAAALSIARRVSRMPANARTPGQDCPGRSASKAGLLLGLRPRLTGRRRQCLRRSTRPTSALVGALRLTPAGPPQVAFTPLHGVVQSDAVATDSSPGG